MDKLDDMAGMLRNIANGKFPEDLGTYPGLYQGGLKIKFSICFLFHMVAL